MEATGKPMSTFEKHCSDLRVKHALSHPSTASYPTVEEIIREKLTEHGLWPNERVDDVIERCKNHNTLLKEMVNRWNDKIDDYPPQLLAVLWLSVKLITVEYIDEVIPLAFYRPMFAN